nr:ubiquitin hydrolase [Tanacetum cinerariifolium]
MMFLLLLLKSTPPKKDLSWTGLPEFADDTITDYSRPSPTIESSPDDAQNKNPSTETEASDSTILSKPAIKFVKAADKATKRPTTDKVKNTNKLTVKYAELYRKPSKKPTVRGNQRNWNNLKSQQLGPKFVMKKKACFNCGDFNHLSYDCRKMVKKSFTPRPDTVLFILSSPKKDLSWTGLPEFADDTVTDYRRPSPTIETDKATERPTTDKVKTAKKPAVKYVKLYRKPSKKPTVRGNQRNWSNLKSQQLGTNFVMKKKACYNCGGIDHLSYNCGLGVKMGRSSPKNNYTHRSMPPRPAIHRPYRPMRT